MFKNKSKLYELYRPNYPYSLILFLKDNNLLKKDDLIAEIGSGTGKLTGLLLGNGNCVYGVEKDEEMQFFLANKFHSNTNFVIVKESAEDTRLPNDKFDLIVSAQSFHLFNSVRAKEEFLRIIKPNGKMAFIWYHWNTNQEVTQKIQRLFYIFREKQNQKERSQIELDFFNKLFYPNKVQYNIVDTIQQKFSKNEFLNSMLSSSYAPSPNDKLFEDYLEEVEKIFNHFEKSGYIEYSFNLVIYYLYLRRQ